MFFADPDAAFANIARALRPSGRLVMMVWQTRDRNEWATTIQQSLTPDRAPSPTPTEGPNAFSLAGPPTVTEILTAAGFSAVTFTDVREPVYYGPDVAAALTWVCGFSTTSAALKQLDSAAADRALERLRAALAAHATDDGIWLDSRAWIVTADRTS
ncbi:class I SAM-dependent methyltransferase [Nocardia sp. NBC_00508]|uniref:hypothetical protein n=1 Tax=Nocardia sp. NBC_00508 TaxID=2975992 RepID=UPI002E7FBA3F|nr:hypothetical protein [Nocardia sp. NBC_00508]WUD66036.1 class I SAM-dependent methyltransferase [Nocardia sp. NBC_00508]